MLDAKLVSSCFNCPSRARPHLSLLLASRGVSVKTLLKVKPGPMGHPSLPKSNDTKKNKKSLITHKKRLNLQTLHPIALFSH